MPTRSPIGTCGWPKPNTSEEVDPNTAANDDYHTEWHAYGGQLQIKRGILDGCTSLLKGVVLGRNVLKDLGLLFS